MQFVKADGLIILQNLMKSAYEDADSIKALTGVTVIASTMPTYLIAGTQRQTNIEAVAVTRSGDYVAFIIHFGRERTMRVIEGNLYNLTETGVSDILDLTVTEFFKVMPMQRAA
jgi:hypothetical protein